MAVFTIVGLTLKEAIRKRTLVGALLLGLLALGISLMLMLIRAQLHLQLTTGRDTVAEFATKYVTATSLIAGVCLFFIRILGMLFAILMAGGSVSGEIESGLLAVILPKPVQRWQILLGKWIGINLVLISSVLLWVGLCYASLKLQSHADLEEMLCVAPAFALYPVLMSTVTLTFSAVYQRVLGTSLALVVGILSYADGIFNFLGDNFNVSSLVSVGHFCGLLMPQGYVAWRIKDNTETMFAANRAMQQSPLHSSRLMQEWGEKHLHFSYLDGVYIGAYVLVIFLIGAILFQRREVS